MNALVRKPNLVITDRNIFDPPPPKTDKDILKEVLEKVQGLRQYQIETDNGEWDSCCPPCGECAYCELNRLMQENGFELLPAPENGNDYRRK